MKTDDLRFFEGRPEMPLDVEHGELGWLVPLVLIVVNLIMLGFIGLVAYEMYPFV